MLISRINYNNLLGYGMNQHKSDLNGRINNGNLLSYGMWQYKSHLNASQIIQTKSRLNLTHLISYHFTRQSKASQLILYSQRQIQNLHYQSTKNNKKQKQWSTIKQKNEKFIVSLVGLPNCGKSSLFNCLIGERLAIVDKEYGMTRDRREFNILGGMVTVVDTPGVQVSLLSKSSTGSKFDQPSQNQLKQDIFQQTLNAINQSDMILFIIDSKKQSLSQEQIILAKYLKAFNSSTSNSGKKCQIIIVCNKCDGFGYDENYILNEIYSKLPTYQQAQPKEQTHKNESSQPIASESKSKTQNIFYCSAQQGTGVFEILQYINNRVPYEMKQQNDKVKKQRREKFQSLVKKMKEQIRGINQSIDKKQSQGKEHNGQMKQQQRTGQDKEGQKRPRRHKDSKRLRIKQWQNDFRGLNPNPEENQQLDNQNYQDYFMRPQQAFSANSRGVDIKNLRMKHSIKICFIGRPNVGKSSLINQLLGHEKMIVSDIPHTTRDSLTTKLLYKNRKIQVIDTAGLNTPRFDQNQQEYLRKSQISTMLHVQQSHVVVYVMDAFSAFKVDDYKLINRVIDEGRPVVIVVNKWQSIKQQYKGKARQYLMSQIQKNLGQLHGYPIVFVSAKILLNIDHMMDKIVTTYDKWNKRISTGLLNNWLQRFKKLDNLPKDEQCTLKINYMIQAKVRPPHFVLFVNNKLIFKNNYMRFLMRNMAEEFQLDGVPLRHTLRSTNNKENQYSQRKRKKSSGEISKKKKSKMTGKMDDLRKKYGDWTV